MAVENSDMLNVLVYEMIDKKPNSVTDTWNPEVVRWQQLQITVNGATVLAASSLVWLALTII